MEKLGAPQLESVRKMSSDRLREKLLNQGIRVRILSGIWTEKL